MKNARQQIILDIITAGEVETQHQLIERLVERGYSATQATISRDIKELHLVKELTTRGVYRYAIGANTEENNYSVRLKAIFRECVTSCAAAQNIVVLKTLPGLAPAACAAIDGMQTISIAGTLAGDDTAFLAMTDSHAAEKFCEEIEAMLK